MRDKERKSYPKSVDVVFNEKVYANEQTMLYMIKRCSRPASEYNTLQENVDFWYWTSSGLI